MLDERKWTFYVLNDYIEGSAASAAQFFKLVRFGSELVSKSLDLLERSKPQKAPAPFN
jgi:hypothetical protein